MEFREEPHERAHLRVARIVTQRKTIVTGIVVLVVSLAAGAGLASGDSQNTSGSPAPPTAADIGRIDPSPGPEPAAADAGGPAETPASEASESAYEDLSAIEAAELAADEFPEIVGAPGWDGIDPPPGTHLAGYIGDMAAIAKPDLDPTQALPGSGHRSDFVPGAVIASAGHPIRALASRETFVP